MKNKLVPNLSLFHFERQSSRVCRIRILGSYGACRSYSI